MSDNPVMLLPETGELRDLHPAQTLRPRYLAAMADTPLGPIPWRLRLQISGPNHTTLGLELKPQLILGRSKSPDGPQPDLDLAPYGGEQGGVSRRHAQIIFDGESLFLEDLGSTNGTRLNGYRLQAGEQYRLRDGDELLLGSLRILLRFVTSPKSD